MSGSTRLTKVRYDGAKALTKAPHASPLEVTWSDVPTGRLAETRLEVRGQVAKVASDKVSELKATAPHAIASGARRSARTAVRTPLALTRATGATVRSEAGASANATEASVNASFDRTEAAMSPEAARGYARTLRSLWNHLPAQRARAVQDKLDAKSIKAFSKASSQAAASQRAMARAGALVIDGVSETNPVVSHEARHAKRLWLRSRRGMAKAQAYAGHGKGLRATVSRLRLGWADVRRKAFGWRGVAVAALAALVLSLGSFAIQGVPTLVAGLAGGSNSSDSLDGVETAVASWLRTAGYSDVQIAAICGNLFAESGGDPTAYAVNDGLSWPYDRAYGLYQFTDCGSSSTNLASSNMTAFFQWCEDNGKSRDSVVAQTEYAFRDLRSDWITRNHTSGYYSGVVPEYRNRDVSWESWQTTDDVRFATYMFQACYERGAAAYLHMDKRYAEAQRVYAALKAGASLDGGSSQSYADASAAGRAIADAARRTGATGRGYCAAWVTSVMAKAGVSVGGNACDMYYAYCTSTDRAALKVGMIVAVPKVIPNGTALSRAYGHVGIYVGDGMVMHSTEGSVHTDTLDNWLGIYARGATAKWGFPTGVE